MNTLRKLVFAATAVALVGIAHARIERVVEKNFTVTGSGTIRLQTSGGGLTVLAGPEGRVDVVAKQKIRASSDAEADELLQDLELKFEQSGNDVSASAKYDRSSWGPTPVSVEFVATVPASYAAELRTSGGSVNVGDIAGQVIARTSGGSIKLGNLGGKVDAHTSGGSISLGEANGTAKLETSGGSITVGRVAGPAELSTSGGSIRIESVEERVRAHTSGGSIRARIVGPLKGDCSLSTSGGSVRVHVDKAAAFRLDASTSGGGVDAEGLTLTLEGGGSRSRSKIVGDVNGGGALLKLRSSGGGVSVAAN